MAGLRSVKVLASWCVLLVVHPGLFLIPEILFIVAVALRSLGDVVAHIG